MKILKSPIVIGAFASLGTLALLSTPVSAPIMLGALGLAALGSAKAGAREITSENVALSNMSVDLRDSNATIKLSTGDSYSYDELISSGSKIIAICNAEKTSCQDVDVVTPFQNTIGNFGLIKMNQPVDSGPEPVAVCSAEDCQYVFGEDEPNNSFPIKMANVFAEGEGFGSQIYQSLSGALGESYQVLQQQYHESSTTCLGVVFICDGNNCQDAPESCSAGEEWC